MEFRRIWALRGPNRWAGFPSLEVELDLGALKGRASHRIPGFNERLMAWLPSLMEHRCSTEERGGFFERLRRGTDLAHILEHVTLELQSLSGSDVRFGRERQISAQGVYQVVIEYEEEEVARACLSVARELCLAAVEGRRFDTETELQRLRDLAYDVKLGPSTGAIVRAAKARGIPCRRLNRASLVQLGQGARSRRILTAETDRTGAIAEAVAQDKQLTRALLKAVGVPVPEGRRVENADDAWEAARHLGLPVVVKPQFGNHGRGVATNLRTESQVRQAYAAACEEGSSILVETFAPGRDHRLLVIGDRLVAAALREPAQVVGNGVSSIRQLVDEANKDPRRSDGHSTSLSFIRLDTVGLGVLSDQGLTPDSIPAEGRVVFIRRNGNLSTGGTATDVTDRVHPEVAARAVDAARMVGLDIAGVDVVALDIGRPLEAQQGAIVEVNAGPGLRMHLEPSAGRPRPVGEAIVSLLFPPHENGRIPTVAVTGVNGKTTTTRLIAHILRGTGKRVGMTCTDGIYIGERRIDARDCSGPRSARSVLTHPQVEAAVFETARGGILREGLGFDRCDVGVVTNIGQGDHLGLRGIDTLDQLARVKRTVIEAVAREGTGVLNADDPLVAAMADHCPGAVVYFGRSAGNPLIAAHRAKGGKAAFIGESALMLATGGREEMLTPLSRAAMTHGGKVGFQIENSLAAAAAAWSLGVPLDRIREGLETFAGDMHQAPGRFNVIHNGDSTIIIDYAHNPSALAALVEATDAFPLERRTLVFSGFNRSDAEMVEMGRILGNGFDRVILFEDRGNRDRRDGELNALIRQGLSAGSRVSEVVDTDDELCAIETALTSQGPGELLVIGTEVMEDSLPFVERFFAARVST
ncbi:MAG: cyanophycin synthetase [Candidatus Desulfacyla sp.]